MHKKLSITAGLAVSALLLWLACRRVDFNALAVILTGIKSAPLIFIFFTVLSELAIRGLKWSLLLSPAGTARAWDTLRLETAGLALNNVLPLRLGDLARAAFGADFFNINIVTVLSTILAEKALDLTALLLLAAAAARIAGLAVGTAGAGLLWILLTLFTAAGAALFYGRRTGHSSAFIRKESGLKKFVDSLALGFRAFKSPAAAAGIFALALAQWFMNALNYYWLARAFNIENSVPLTKSVLLSFTGAAASSAPGMPGYFGSFELALSAVLSAWGVNKDAAFAYAAVAHLLSYLIITALGLFFVYQMGQSLGAVWIKFSKKKFKTGAVKF